MKYTDLVKCINEAATSTKQLKHLSHLEELIFEEGAKAIPDIISSIEAFLSILQERKFTDKTKLTTKWDGSPSVVIHSKDGDFWVASKSAFNKDPKLNRTVEDIEKNHGHAPGLVEKLTYALKYCKALGINGTVQGDFLYTKEDLKTQTIDGESYIVFKPNTITYAVPVNSKLGKTISASKLGIIIHTEYDENMNTKTVGGYSVANLKKTKDVFFDDAQIKDITASVSLTKEQNTHALEALAKIKALAKSIPSKFLNDLADHPEVAPLMAKYNNANVRAGSYATPNAAKEFSKYIHGEYEKDIIKLKTEKKKEEKQTKRDENIKFVEDNMNNLTNTYELYSIVNDIKILILKQLNKLSPLMKSFMETENGLQATPAEGFVAIHSGRAFKLVDRLDFSAKNFAARPRPVKESTDMELDEARATDKDTVVFCFGRSNPPTLGHKLMFDKVVAEARKRGADYQIWISKSQDKKKNPLDVKTKLFWLKKMFPNFVFHGATQELATLMNVAQHLNSKYKKLVMVAGSDRINQYKDLLNAYNGKDYNYDSIELVSAGERDPDEDGVSGISATKMRNAALADDVNAFSKGVPNTMSKEDIIKLMDEVKQGMAKTKAKKKTINEATESSTGMEIAQNIYRILVGGHPLEELEDPNEVVREAMRLSKTKEFTDELSKLVDAGKKAGLTIDVPVSDEDDEYKPQQVTYSEFMKMLGSEKPGTSKDYVTTAKKHYVKEDAESDEEESDEEESEEHDEMSDDEIDSVVDSIDDEDIMDLYDDDEFAVVDSETGEVVDEDDSGEDKDENEEEMEECLQLDEVLSRQGRIKRAMKFARTETKRERAKQLALHRLSSAKKIVKRARAAAIKAVKQKMFKNRDTSKLSIQEKERAERRVQALSKSGALSKIAMKLIPKIRKIEKTRLSHNKYTK